VALALRASAPAVPTAPTVRFRLTNPPNLIITHPKLSPDGRSVAYLAGDQVMIQDLDQLEPRSLAQDADLRDVFWAPDGKYVGYIAGKKAVKVPRGGGETQVVSVTSQAFTNGSGGCWGDDGTLYLTHAETDGMLAVSAVGGDARVLFAPDSTQESDFHQPAALPGNRGILFVPHRNAAGPDAIEVWDGKARHVVFEAPGQRIDHPVYAPGGYIVFSRVPENPGIWAFPFSLDKLERTGEPFLVAALGQSPTVSDDGTLVYLEGSDVGQQQLVWLDGDGREIGTAGPPLRVATTMIDVSGDGNRVALSTLDADQPDISILDLARGTNSRLTVDDNVEYDVKWSPDGASVYYSVAPKGASLFSRWSIVRRLADGSGVPDTLAPGFGPDPTPDGKMMVFSRPESQETIPIFVMSLEGDRTPRPLVRVKGWVIGSRVSPDGRYLAYDSNESGRHEIYLKRFPDGEGRWLVSTGGGQWPHWNAKGDRLFYTHDRDIMEVEVTLGASPVLKPPKKLFTRPVLNGAGQGGWDPGFAVTADGTRFLVARDVEGGPQPAAVAVTNWAREFANRSGR
jgi:Tol biopolymer transport system component